MSTNTHDGAPIRVAVLDERLVAEAISTALRSSGLEVVVAACEWSEFISHPGMPVDVAVIDLRAGDGPLIPTRVRELAAMGTTTVVTSAKIGSAPVRAAVRSGALAVVARSDSFENLVAAIRAAASGTLHLPFDRNTGDPNTDGPNSDGPAGSSEIPDPGLGRREERALVLYAGGRSIREVAAEMETTEETVKSYIKRARRKFRDVDIDIGTRILLRKHAAREGWLGHE